MDWESKGLLARLRDGSAHAGPVPSNGPSAEGNDVVFHQRREAKARAEKLAELGRLAAGILHELKNPLLVVDGRLQLIESQIADGRIPATPSLLAHLGKMAEASQRMKRILQGLSNYSRPARVELIVLDIGELLAEAADLVAFQTRSSTVAVKVEVHDAPIRVRADRSEMFQILLNLALNGVEAMAEEGGTLVMRVYGAPPEVVVEIADSGPGIGPEALAGMWQPFYTTKPDGTGLGLPIVAALVARQPGARITVESDIGAGTTFRFTMPAAADTTP